MNYLQQLSRIAVNCQLKFTTMIGIFFALFAITTQAQTIIKPEPLGTTYTVKPDYRKCAFPICGGWYLTPVNQYSLYLQTEDEAYATANLLPNTIYVAYINYKRLGLDEKQIAELENAIRNDQALVRGTITSTPVTNRLAPRTQTLVANGAWVGANKNIPTGPYLNITSTGIVCITTPCPYFKANIINSDYSSEIHALSFEKAALEREQEAQAWQAVSTTGLIITGTKYPTTGFDETGAEPGTGVGVAATKVFFAFPTKH